MLSSWDDFPVHQTSQPVRNVATSDRNFYDRYYFNAHNCSGDLFLVLGLGLSPAGAMGVIVLEGLLVTLLVLVGLREAIMRAVPHEIKLSIGVGIGLFISLVGFRDAGITVNNDATGISLGVLTAGAPLVALAGLLVMIVLTARGVRGAILIGILATSALAFLTGVAAAPASVFSPPPDIRPTLFALDVGAALTWGFASVILTIFVLDLVDTIGTLTGLSVKAGLLDEEGRLPGIERALQCDAFSTVLGALLGTTTSGAYIESSAGIEAGGRTGLTAVVTAVWFLAALFFAPLLSAVPPSAYGPALVVVGMLMLEPVSRFRFDDVGELAPAFLTIALMCFTYDLAIGLTAGFVVWVLLKVLTGRAREVPGGMWALAGLSSLFYVLYPY